MSAAAHARQLYHHNELGLVSGYFVSRIEWTFCRSKIHFIGDTKFFVIIRLPLHFIITSCLTIAHLLWGSTACSLLRILFGYLAYQFFFLVPCAQQCCRFSRPLFPLTRACRWLPVASERVCVCVCVCVYMYTCVCVCMHIYIHTVCIYTHTHTHTHT